MARSTTHPGRGFTLTEVLVAVAAISVLTVAIAQIFQTVGSTVDAGRAVSRFNTVSSRIERQMREDLNGITRDGYLAIRHALIGSNGKDLLPAGDRPNGDPKTWPLSDQLPWVELSPEDPNPRPRRADEIVFFSTGSFTTARAPLVPGMTATSNSARIYYGHGVRQPRGLEKDRADTPGNERLPEVNDDWVPLDGEDTENYRLGGNGRLEPGDRGPNEYAADWSLLRQVTLLAGQNPSDLIPLESQESLIKMGLRENDLNGAVPDRSVAKDRPFQIAGQPASSSVFGAVGFLPLQPNEPDARPRFYLRNFQPQGPGALRSEGLTSQNTVRPLYASGLIDTTTEELSQVMRVVNGAAIFDSLSGFGFEGPADVNVRNSGSSGGLLLNVPAAGAAGANVFRSSLSPAVPIGDTNVSQFGTANMQAWMREGFPTLDLPRSLGAAQSSGVPAVWQWAARRRIRYENGAPDVYFLLTEDNSDGGFQARIQNEIEIERAQRLADQSMLSSAIFAPGCSEFIVEWSFGRVASDFDSSDAGELIWHGLARVGEDNDPEIVDGSPNSTADQNNYIVREYPFRRLDDNGNNLEIGLQPVATGSDFVVLPELIHGDTTQGDGGNPNAGSGLFGSRSGSSASFEWDEPLYRANVYGLRGDQDNQADRVELYSYFGSRDVLSVPDAATEWVWPKLIRITVTLTDPTDPLVEETFQFVFEVPGA